MKLLIDDCVKRYNHIIKKYDYLGNTRGKKTKKEINYFNKHNPPNINNIPTKCLKFIFLFINNIVKTNNINTFKFITDTDLLGLSEFFNELNIQGSTIINTINNLNIIKNMSL